MTTELITLNEYRKNLSRLWKISQEKNIKYIVMVHSKPVFEVSPIASRDGDANYGLYEVSSVRKLDQGDLSKASLEDRYQSMSEDSEYQKEMTGNTKYLGYL